MAPGYLCRYNQDGLQEFFSSSNILLQSLHSSPPPKHHPQPSTSPQQQKKAQNLLLIFLFSKSSWEISDEFTYPMTSRGWKSVRKVGHGPGGNSDRQGGEEEEEEEKGEKCEEGGQKFGSHWCCFLLERRDCGNEFIDNNERVNLELQGKRKQHGFC